MPPKKQQYTHLSQRNQILKRPGQHIGSTRTTRHDAWIVQTECIEGEERERIVEQEISHNPGLMHIFYEVLSNAQDNYFYSKDSSTPLRKIEVTVDKESGMVSVWNDGLSIPTRIHEWQEDEEIIEDRDFYEAEIIFGYLNSSGNYNDEKESRIGGGLHGVGVKLTNIFSTEFTIECFDPESGLRLRQTFRDNMSILGKPRIAKLKQKKGYTKVSYIADFKKFGLEGYSETDLSVMKKMCVDSAMITGQRTIFNGEVVPVKTLVAYSRYYTDTERIEFRSVDSMVVLCEKPIFETGFTHISFVNGIATAKGGVHIDAWRKAIFMPLLEKIKGKYSPKGKKSNPVKITMKNLENYFMLFVSCNLENPDFEGQTKGVLNSPIPQTNVTVGKINSIMKWNFIKDIEETIRLQGMKELKKTDGNKATSINIPKADDANKAGTVKSGECILFITEGDSAKAFAVKGISAIENGTDWFGVLPVRGKVLNVRTHTADQINKHEEISQIKKILGLKHGADYTDPEMLRTLRYGKVRILTDSDRDGDHIKGLIINFFQYSFPSLLSQNYISSIRTPIVKAKRGNKIVSFYYPRDFKIWAEKQTEKFTAKYYKGLGTSNDSEIFEIFENPKYVQYIEDENTKESVDMIFSKTRSDERKKWLEEYQEKDFKYREKRGIEQVPISKFFNNEMIGFSIYANIRSIPSVVDGFKPSQRKALWAGLSVLSKEYKVTQFAAEVAKRAEYHHGESSMEQTIIGMAQSFVGSNNISLFYEAGQFGTRACGGKDASSPRYIFTRLSSITRFIFRKEDDPILEYLEDEGRQIEPKYFVPIIPMLLVNGSTGIGTGYSSDVPCFNPLELVGWIRGWLENAENLQDSDLKPWYAGYKGYIEKDENDPKKFSYYGEVKQVKDNLFEITELPIGVWTDSYKELLNSLKNGATSKKTRATGYNSLNVAQLKEELNSRKLPTSGLKKNLMDRLKDDDKKNGTTAKKFGGGGQITKWEWHGDAYKVNFKVWTKAGVEINYDNKKFELCIKKNSVAKNLNNMTAFTPEGGIKKYSELDEILRTFCQVRLKYYKKRKKNLICTLEERLRMMETKARFISEVLKNPGLLRQTEEELFQYFEEQDYWSVDGSFKFLTDMRVGAFTKDKYRALLKQITELKKEISYVKKTSPKQMWETELDEFVEAYKRWRTEMDKLHTQLAKRKIKRR